MLDLSFYRNRRVFITGITGFKGAWLSHFLLSLNAEVTGYALAAEDPSLFKQTELAKKVNVITGDVRDGEALCAALRSAKSDVVFHLAAQPIVRRAYREPRLTYETNVMGTVNILEALRTAEGVRSFVNVTTDKVYENREWHWGYRENETLRGFDPYSNSKSCSELVTQSYRDSFFQAEGSTPLSTARSGNVIGGGDYAEDRLIPDGVRAALAGAPLVVRNPASTRPWQHVLDCLSGYLVLAARQAEDPRLVGAWNFGPDDESAVSAGDLASLFCQAWGGIAWTASEDGAGPHEAHFLKLDCSKAKALLGWKPRWTLRTAVQKTVEFAKTGSAERSARILQQIQEYVS